MNSHQNIFNSSSKQNKPTSPKNIDSQQGNSLNKLKIPPKNICTLTFPELPHKKLNLSKRVSAISNKAPRTSYKNLLKVKVSRKQLEVSQKGFSKHPSPSKNSQRKLSIIELLMNPKSNTSVYDKLQSKYYIKDDSNNSIATDLIGQNEQKSVQKKVPQTQVQQNQVLPAVSLSFEFLSIHSQFSIVVNNLNPNPIKKDVSAQTIYKGIEDGAFFNEYVKYKTHKEKYQSMLVSKRQKIEQIVKQHEKFEKDYQNLISSVNRPPSDSREKRVLHLAKDLEEAQKTVLLAFNSIYQTSQKWDQILKQQSNSYYKKKNQILTSIRHLSKCILKQFDSSKDQGHQSNVFARIFERIIRQFKYLGGVDDSNRRFLSNAYKIYQQKVIQFQTTFKVWKDLLYQNRVLLYNFMRQIQKIPLIMTEVFGFGQISSIDILALDKCVKPSLNPMSCCEDCYTFKKNVKHMQVWNNQLKPVFKTVKWLIRDGDKKKECMELI